ncbi:MAG: hypothetical protein WD830_10890 [Chloroflexota bacterium]
MRTARLTLWLATAAIATACMTVVRPQEPVFAAPVATPVTATLPADDSADPSLGPLCLSGQVSVGLVSAVARPVGGQIDLLFTNRSDVACLLASDLPVALIDANGTFLLDSGRPPEIFGGTLIEPGGTSGRTVFWDNWCRAMPPPFTLVVGHGHTVFGRVPIAADAVAPCVDANEPPRLQHAL